MDIDGITILQFNLIPILWFWPFSTCTRYPSILGFSPLCPCRQCQGQRKSKMPRPRRTQKWAVKLGLDSKPRTPDMFLLFTHKLGWSRNVLHSQACHRPSGYLCNGKFCFPELLLKSTLMFYLLIPYAVRIRFPVKKKHSQGIVLEPQGLCCGYVARPASSICSLVSIRRLMGSNQGGTGEASL